MRVAVIPARGGSRRIPRKNIRSFAGRPILEWSIDCARDSGLFDVIVLSTDDEEIASVGKAAGALAPFRRPAKLADDFTATGAVIAHALGELARFGWDVAECCCIYPTAPLLKSKNLVAAAELRKKGDWDYVFAATRFSFPPQRGLILQQDDSIQPWQPENIARRSQDLAIIYHDAGQFYFGRGDAWRASAPVFGSRSTFVELDPWQVCDIDTLADWEMAERLALVSLERSPVGPAQ